MTPQEIALSILYGNISAARNFILSGGTGFSQDDSSAATTTALDVILALAPYAPSDIDNPTEWAVLSVRRCLGGF